MTERQQISAEQLLNTPRVIDREPAIDKGEPPVVFLLGWNEKPSDYEEGLQELINAHRRVLVISNARPKITAKGEEIHRQYAEEVNTILAEKGISGWINICARSGGTITGVEFARKHSDRVANMVLLNPQGLIGKKRKVNLAYRFVKQARQSFGDRSEVSNNRSFSGLHNPLPLLKEAYAISQRHIEDDLTSLRNHGIGIAVIATEQDILGSFKEIRVTIPELNREEGFAIVDRLYSMPGTHNEARKQQRTFMHIADSAFTDLWNLRQGNSNAGTLQQ